MPSPAGVLDVTPFLRPERDALLELLAGLSPDDWDRPTECPQWTVKGIALHILGDDLSLLSRQRDESTDSLTIFATAHAGLTFRELLDGFNNEWVRAAEFLSHDLVLEQLRHDGVRNRAGARLGRVVTQRCAGQRVDHRGEPRCRRILDTATRARSMVGREPCQAHA